MSVVGMFRSIRVSFILFLVGVSIISSVLCSCDGVEWNSWDKKQEIFLCLNDDGSGTISVNFYEYLTKYDSVRHITVALDSFSKPMTDLSKSKIKDTFTYDLDTSAKHFGEGVKIDSVSALGDTTRHLLRIRYSFKDVNKVHFPEFLETNFRELDSLKNRDSALKVIKTTEFMFNYKRGKLNRLAIYIPEKVWRNLYSNPEAKEKTSITDFIHDQYILYWFENVTIKFNTDNLTTDAIRKQGNLIPIININGDTLKQKGNSVLQQYMVTHKGATMRDALHDPKLVIPGFMIQPKRVIHVSFKE